MTEENQATLIRAYRTAIESGQNEIADLLENVILTEMRLSKVKVPVMRDIKTGDGETQIKPPWNVTCGPDIVPLCGGITVSTDHSSKEVMA